MIFSELEKTFTNMGGEFISSPIVISNKLKKVKVLVFDWDGVWHSGRKSGNGQSSFSEVDSMGLNMLRFGYYLQNGEIPITLIITGENNQTAFDFAEREHLDGVFYKAKNKNDALDFVLDKWNIQPEEVLFAFDDILDLGMAKRIGAGFFVKGQGNMLFEKFVKRNKICLYKTSVNGEQNAVREIAELSLGLLKRFDEAIENRMNFTKVYQDYFGKRNVIPTYFYTPKGEIITKVERP